MNTSTILAELRGERDRINRAIAALETLESAAAPAKPGKKAPAVAVVKAGVPKRRTMSASARKRISDAAKKRWAALRKTKVGVKA
jgi:hypothetical protein